MGENKTVQRNVFIDVLKGLSILAVVFYHLGVFSWGYLGVDIFFGIAGYLTTRTIASAMQQGGFRYFGFVYKRLLRICPLLFVISLLCLIAGIFTMLPDDLENLSESVVATNVFANNILQCITTRDYWDVVNDYKPLLHTWYLGVLVQFYLAYPLVFHACWKVSKGRNAVLIGILSIMTAVSLALYIKCGTATGFGETAPRFYYLPYRFFEFGIGAILALAFRGSAFSIGLKMPGNFVVRALATVGVSSFSIYLCHQPIIAFIRYVWTNDITIPVFAVFTAAVVLASWLAYGCFEGRNALFVRSRKAAIGCSLAAFAIGTSLGLAAYGKAGVVRDVPELGVARQSARRGMYSEYNARVSRMQRPFATADKIRVLCVGDSFARDTVNILLSSPVSNKVEIAYASGSNFQTDFRAWADAADYVIYAGADYSKGIPEPLRPYLKSDRFFVVGNKRFGECNGIIYNRRWRKDYFDQTVPVPGWLTDQNEQLRKEFGPRFIDVMSPVSSGGRVRVFTDDHMFISQDCRHLTVAGARYFAKVISFDFIKDRKQR